MSKRQPGTWNLTIDLNGLRRGDAYNGGRFVGKTRTSSMWVCYESGDAPFRRMCESFDRLYGPQARRRVASVA